MVATIAAVETLAAGAAVGAGAAGADWLVTGGCGGAEVESINGSLGGARLSSKYFVCNALRAFLRLFSFRLASAGKAAEFIPNRLSHFRAKPYKFDPDS